MYNRKSALVLIRKADADYSPETEFDFQEAKEIFVKTKEFVEKLRSIIEVELKN